MDFISVRRSGKREANRRIFEAAIATGKRVLFIGADGVVRLYERAQHGVVTVTPVNPSDKPCTVWQDDLYRFGSY
ncbi:MAG TPA: hypothetical protein VF275_05465 [Gammaproteobacteria bacterium]